MAKIRTDEKANSFFSFTVRIWLKIYYSLIAGFSPFFDLILRLTIAQLVFRSAVVKLADFDGAVFLARNEYPVTWLPPETAALIGLAIEVITPILLAMGLFTRTAALALMSLLLVSHFAYRPIDLNLFVSGLLLLLMIRGAGAFSMDRLLGRGIEDSAIPIAPVFVKLGTYTKEYGLPILLLLFRVWLAITLLIAADFSQALVQLNISSDNIFPAGTFRHINSSVLIFFAALSLLGFATPLLILGLILSLSASHVMGIDSEFSIFTTLFLLVTLFFGAGHLSIDRMIAKWLDDKIIFAKDSDEVPEHWPHIVVVGGGFGGLSCVSYLKNLPVRITLIDQRNYHLFQPLLYQIATASLSPADVATPIRGLYRDNKNVRTLLGTVSGVDTKNKKVEYDNRSLDYDYLVLATGAEHSYFGKDEWAPFAPGLKRIEDALAVRGDVLKAFERAEASDDPDYIKRLLTFVIVGAGPTGVELAGAIAELAHHGLEGEYDNINPADARIILVQADDRILPTFPKDLSAKAATDLEKLGVEIKLGARVTNIEAHKVCIAEEQIDSETILWAAGVMASPAGKWLDTETDRAGRVIVDERLRVKGYDDIFAIGDTASSNGWNGGPVPGLAPAAKQAGKYVGKVIRGDISNQPLANNFAYSHQGSLATIGRKSAVADFGWIKLHGATAWWLWGAVHVGFLSGTRNRISVLVNWIWSYFTFRLGIRLITNDEDE